MDEIARAWRWTVLLLLVAAAGLCASGCGAGPPVADPASSQPLTPTSAQVTAETYCGSAANHDRTLARFVSIAGSSAGTVDCGEAVAITAAYLTQPRNTHLATIEGWSCRGQRDNSIANICIKDGAQIVMRTVGP